MSSIHPIPKSVHARPRRPMSTRDLKYAKQEPDRRPDYAKWIRGHECVLAGSVTDCWGRTEHAHLATCGRGIKGSDLLAVPLCTYHHRLSHQVGLDYFQDVHFVNLWRIAAELLAAWIREER